MLAGARNLDPAERALVDDGPIPLRTTENLRLPAGPVYLHIDLDVLDPAEFPGSTCPEPDGLRIADVVTAIRDNPQWTVVGAGITECVTTDPAELRVLVPLLEAVGEALG